MYNLLRATNALWFKEYLQDIKSESEVHELTDNLRVDWRQCLELFIISLAVVIPYSYFVIQEDPHIIEVVKYFLLFLIPVSVVLIPVSVIMLKSSLVKYHEDAEKRIAEIKKRKKSLPPLQLPH